MCVRPDRPTIQSTLSGICPGTNRPETGVRMMPVDLPGHYLAQPGINSRAHRIGLSGCPGKIPILPTTYCSYPNTVFFFSSYA